MDTSKHDSRAFWTAVAALYLVPAAHPLLIPAVGVPSHLLWWIHVLPVALVTYRAGRAGLAWSTGLSLLAVLAGERSFGAGYGVPADWATVAALTTAVPLTGMLVGGFALYARAVTRRYRSLFDAAGAAILRVDTSDTVVAANMAALKLLGTWDSVVGMPLGSVPGLSSLPALGELERGWSGSICVGDPDRPREVHLAATAVADGSDGSQIILVDRTTEVAQEREIDRQSRLSTLGEALAGVAHELKNPLAVIVGYAEMGIQDTNTPDPVRSDLSAILEQGLRMSDLVTELLGFSRKREDGHTVRVDELVERVVAVQAMVHGKRIRIREEIHYRGDAVAVASKVEQILVNLISNAADAVGERGEITVRVDREAGFARVIVADDGPGIESGLLEEIFQPFVTTKPEGVGTGLGLAISRKLAATMGGSLGAENRDGGGAAFTLRLPAPEVASGADARGDPGERAERTSGASRARART